MTEEQNLLSLARSVNKLLKQERRFEDAFNYAFANPNLCLSSGYDEAKSRVGAILNGWRMKKSLPRSSPIRTKKWKLAPRPVQQDLFTHHPFPD